MAVFCMYCMLDAIIVAQVWTKIMYPGQMTVVYLLLQLLL